MKIIKIEGDLLGSAEGVQHVIEQLSRSLNDTTACILVTGNPVTEQQLVDIGKKSQQQGFDFSSTLLEIEATYLELARAVTPVIQQSAVLSFIRKRFNEVDDMCKGIQLLGACPDKTTQKIRSFGSVVLSSIFAASCQSKGMKTRWIESAEDAKAEDAVTPIIPDENISANNLNLVIDSAISNIEIWTGHTPYATADPSIVINAKPITSMTYEEAMELSQFGTPVIHPAALGKAHQYAIPVTIKDLEKFEEDKTLINNIHDQDGNMIAGISSLEHISLVNIEGSGMIGVPGFAKRVFSGLHDAGINIILISQGASEHSICLAVKQEVSQAVIEKLNEVFEVELRKGILQQISVVKNASIIGLVGENMRNHPGISGRMFSALGRNGINILSIAQGSNERDISAVILSSDRKKALNVLHEAFFEHTKKEINIFIIGTGNVGKKLVGQLMMQSQKIERSQNLKLNVIGLCNSKKMIIQQEGIDLSNWEKALADGDNSNPAQFKQQMIDLNLRNSVLVDITANKVIPELYADVLKKSMSVVACNKIAASDKFERYQHLKDLALSYNCKFLFETNVGAALPVIGTLNDLLKSGDRVRKIEAVLSGTLNYVFNYYDGSKPFSEVVRDAQREGYTEPDPRLDLSGTDVMRKIMILAREAGSHIEMEDITCNSFLPESCMKGTVDDFYNEMAANEGHFRKLLDDAKADNAKLKFVANYHDGKASVGLKHISPESDLYHLYGKDNIVLFFTDRYDQTPLSVKGAGAGADVTASGVFADIMRTMNK
ncbi:MAG: bifunctional aspartate kinase/homoserine dehydrogenase I [bacterium]